MESHNVTMVFAGQTQERDIPLSQLVAKRNDEGGVQRALDQSHANRIARKFDWAKWRKPEVVLGEDGLYHIIDGQHRIEAARILSNGQDALVRCDVLADELTLAQQAQRFIGSFRDVRPMSATDKFLTAIVAEDQDAIRYMQIITQYGMKPWRRSSDTKGFVSPAAYKELINAFGRELAFELIDLSLNYATTAWGTDFRFIPSSQFVLCYSLRHWRNHPEFNRLRMLEALRRTNSDKLSKEFRNARVALNSHGLGALTTMGKYYNYKLSDAKKMPMLFEELDGPSVARKTA